MVQQPSYWKVLTRRKCVAADGTDVDTKLNRVLGLYDLTALGVGSTLGAGVYVLAGQIAKEQAGPSVMISFAIAAIASLLAGVCYAEFGARVPKAGSAYVYSYVCIGEFAAFVIGWNLILEYVIGTASVCRGISLYLDSLINDTLKTTFAEVAPINVNFLGSYFDFFAFGLVIVFGVALAFGVETSAMANNFCTCLNIFILMFVIIAGSLKADFSNWSVDVTTVNATNIGSGGFFPFGFAGTLKGAATCFFGFVGFDCIATTGEEVRNPRKNIPRSILLSLLIIFLCYFGVSTVLTLMVPYYMQDSNAPLPYAFESVGWPVAMWIVSIGGLVGLLASLFGALFPLPRIIYSMAQDGLLFRFLGKISLRFRVPVTGSICAAIFTAIIAGLFDLAQLVNLLSIGTLLAYSVVAISVSILRYMESSDDLSPQIEIRELTLTENSMLTSSGTRVTLKGVLAQLFNVRWLRTPNTISTRIVGTMITFFCFLSLGIGLMLMYAYDDIVEHQTWALVLFCVMLLLTALVLLSICLQPREAYTRIFRVPFVPIVPAISIFINIYLMLQLDVMTWIRFTVWMIIGLPIFIACCCMYDSRNPAKRNPERIAFLKALRGNDEPTKYAANGHLPIVIVEANKNKNNNNERHNGHISNEHSVKSLDEIHNLKDVGDDLIEVRSANGKVFYIEDTKSSTSTATLGKDENDVDDSKTVDDEKSVIAMLDDVLEAEDDSLASPAVNNYIFGRHYSVDSEMYPSVIETTIVATVHSSSSDSSEGHLDDVPEVEIENNLSDWHDNFQRYNEHRMAAKDFIDELFASDELWNRFELRHRLLQADNQKETQDSRNSSPLNRVSSRTSILSTGSVADPLHSEKFKHKLIQILMMPQPHNIHKSSKEMSEYSSNTENRLSIKQSKSETDLRLLVQKVTEHLDDENNKNTENGNIPRPPKFDPVLYNTINSLSARKERPPLLKSLTTVDNNPVVNLESSKIESSMPFKSKLEAILRRGPSLLTQQHPEVQARRPKSTHLEDYDRTEVDLVTHAPSVSNLNELRDYDAKDIIANARKSLKPVREHT